MATETRTATEAERASRAEFDAAWDRFFGAMRRARGHSAGVAEREGLSLAQFQLLFAFAGHDAGDRLSVGQLAEAADVAQPTATRMLDGLERQGIVERRPSAEDRRSVEVAVTGDGRKILARKQRLVEKKRKAVYESLPATDREQAARLLSALADAIARESE